MWEETGLITHFLTAGTGFVLQTMEPAFSAVAQQYSTVHTDPTGRALRAAASVMVWIYGGQQALSEADRLREAHAGLNTVDDDGVRYTALASAAWAWVMHAHFYAYLARNEYFARHRLTLADKHALYREMVLLMRNMLVAPKEIPEDFTQWQAWFHTQIDTHLRDTVTAHDYLAVIGTIAPPHHLRGWARPVWRIVTTPVRPLLIFCTIGTLPPAARRKLGLTWTQADERKLRALGWLIGHSVALLPERVRYLPIAYQARRMERDRQRLDAAILSRPI
ncbi:oxygenase MpaB family protein [Nocardia sp. NPDC052566]|uniref:oxygenase MpaB family protein n=1 Tax=Nocardia sp. NPDC052566 TaxID=3364330 RepID=UPI0037CA8138